MEKLHEVTNVATQEDAVDLANEINRMESALKKMKDELKKYVGEHGSVDTGQETWGFYESVSWSFDKEGLKEVARNMALDGVNPWDMMNVTKSNLDKLGWKDEYIEKMGKKRVTQRFTSRKNKN